MSSPNRKLLSRSAKFEYFESRIVMSADPVFDFFSDAQFQAELSAADQDLHVTLDSVHEDTGLNYVHENYQFNGAGQTVAIIDSGIAWDHYALGGGYGDGYQVVGGWDFAENDANPYDDGPAGFHGTHVAGIVGSQDDIHQGVASGVDLVGLRVFDDSGYGSLDWVEQALQWVHDNKDAFRNPITTVNLSLGVDWNSNSLPGWASLEDEFAQLELDGIFISVAAGNSFQNYLEEGLAYPAVSDHVVPVASHDADGNISDFSQRNNRVIVAPGESIRSTVPDHLFGGSQHGQFLAASGTSMASPYLAGASAVLRQAMQFMDYENIDQQSLYQHFRQTANQFHDAVTGNQYLRLNMGAAIDAVVSDSHANHASSATLLGNIQNQTSISGVIGKLDDVDHFRFTASQTGTVTFQLDQSHSLESVLKVNGQELSISNGQVSFDVQSGGQYNLAISTSDGIGHYGIESSFEAAVPAIDLGRVASTTFDTLSVDGVSWYRLSAARNGILTVGADANLNLQVFDAQMNRLAVAHANGTGHVRVDANVNWQETYYVRVQGNHPSFDLQVDNLVSLRDGTLNVFGTYGSDDVQVDARGGFTVTVNSIEYQFSQAEVSVVSVDTFSGSDNARIQLAGHNDQIVMDGSAAAITNGSFSIDIQNNEFIKVFAGGGSDTATFADTAGNDSFLGMTGYARRSGGGAVNQVFDAETVNAFGSIGNDTAELRGTQGSDDAFASAEWSHLRNTSTYLVAAGFDEVKIDGQAGADHSYIKGSDGNDQLVYAGRTAKLVSDGNTISLVSIERNTATGGGGNDQVRFYDTNRDDHFRGHSQWTVMQSDQYVNSASGFEAIVSLKVNDGVDRAVLFGTAANETLHGDHQSVTLQGSEISFTANGFDHVTAFAGGGTDHVNFAGSNNSDWMYATAASTWVWGSSWRTAFHGFDQVTVSGNGGFDRAVLNGSVDNTQFNVDSSATVMSDGGHSVTASGFERQSLDGGGGSNTVLLDGFSNSDRLTATGQALIAYLDDNRIDATNFIWMEATADSGQTADEEISAVDFWYALHGEWD